MQAERSPTTPLGARVDSVALQRVCARVLGARGAPWLHQEAARRMAERLPLIKRQPAMVLDWSGPWGASAPMRQTYPSARHCVVTSHGAAPGAAPTSPRRWWNRRPVRTPVIEMVDEPAVPANAAELLWSNMRLHGDADPVALFEQWHRALAVDGFLMFSTLGPGSLPELRALYRAQGWGEPFAPFVDMHDLGDLLVQAGFADPVMDQELLTLTWPDARSLLNELRGLGGNVSPHRYAGLRTPRWRQRLIESLQQQAVDGRPALTFELVYGHAFKVAPRPRMQAQTAVSLDEMRAMVRLSRP